MMSIVGLMDIHKNKVIVEFYYKYHLTYFNNNKWRNYKIISIVIIYIYIYFFFF